MDLPTFKFIFRAVILIGLTAVCLVLFVYLLNVLNSPAPNVAFVAIISSIVGSVTTSLVQAVNFMFTEDKNNEPPEFRDRVG